MRTTLLALAAIALLGACASQPKPLQGEYAALTPRDAAETDAVQTWLPWNPSVPDAGPPTLSQLVGPAPNAKLRE